MKNVKEIRNVRFSLRMKIALIVIALIIFFSLIVGSAVFNQHKENFNSTLENKTTSILSNSLNDISKLLKVRHDSSNESNNTDEITSNIYDQLYKYKGDPFVDSIFLIDIENFFKNNIKYLYYDYEKNRLVQFNSKSICQNRKKYGLTNGCRYKLINKFLQNHLIKNIEPELLLIESDKEIITGIPIFKEKFDGSYFKKYLSHKNTSLQSKKDFENYKKNKRLLIQYFNNRLIKSSHDYDYEIIFDKKKKIEHLYLFINKFYNITSLHTDRREEFKEELINKVTKNLKEKKIKLSLLKDIIRSLNREYSIQLNDNDSNTKLWHSFYYFLTRNNIKIHTASLEDVAVLSYKNDLIGVAGIILKKDKFVKNFEKSTNETLSILVSILFRMVLLAVFLPAFFIEPISRLTEFAVDIKEKKVKKRILFHGSDEICQLADSLNLLVPSRKKQGVIQRINADKVGDFKNYLFKEKFPDFENLELGSEYIGMNGFCENYFDVFKVKNDTIGIAIAETKVMGNPEKDAFTMPAMKTLLRSFVKNSNNLKAIATQINNYFYENNLNAAMFCGLLNHKKNVLTYFSAGHKKSIILRDGKLKSLPAGGPVLGESEGKDFYSSLELRELRFKKGDYFIQYSNGVINANDSVGNRFSEERFLKTIHSNNGRPPQKMVDSVVTNINDFTGEIKQKNDIALLALRII